MARPNSSTMVSKVQVSPRWLQNTPSMSKGVAPKRSATAGTSDGATNRKTADGIDEAPDQPGTGDAVDLRPGAGHPDRPALGVARRNAVGGDQRQTRLRPGEEPAFEHVGLAAGVAKPGGDALAELLALLADDDCAARRASSGAHAATRGKGPADRAGDEPRIGGKVLVGADIDDRRTLRRADEAA